MKCFWKIPASHKLSSPTALKKEKGEGGGQGEQRKKKKGSQTILPRSVLAQNPYSRAVQLDRLTAQVSELCAAWWVCD